MYKTIFLTFITTAAVVSAGPTNPRVTKSTTFNGNFAEKIIGSLALKSRVPGSSLESRQSGSFNGDVVLCSAANCENCIEISTSGGGATGQCEFTIPNPFFSFGLTNPPVGSFYPFTLGINVAPAACPTNLFHLTQANVCFNVPGGGNGWTFEPGDIAIEN